MTTENYNERDNRDGENSSSNNENGSSPIRKKRTRVGDLRKTNYEVSPSDRARNPYRSDNAGGGSGYSERPARPTFNNDRSEGGYRSSNSSDRPARPSFNNDRSEGGYRSNSNGNSRGGYSNNREGGYSNNREGGNTNTRSSAGYNSNREGGYSNNREGGNTNTRSSGGYNNNREGGYSNNREGGYSNNRDNNRSGGYNNGNSNSGGGYDNRRKPAGGGQSRGGYSSNREGGYSNNREGGQREYRGEQRNSDLRAPKRLVKPVKYKENIDPNTPIRLNKYLANAGVCSRREADSFITSGLVKVNGEIINELGAKVLRGDMVTFNDQAISLESKVYVLLNKPKNCVTTSDDPQNRTTVMDLVQGACPERIYPVGRLDRNTTGVLLLTNDGDLASKLMHPKYKKKKIYQVQLDKDVAIEDMQAIADGIELEDGEIHADSIAYQAEDVLDVVGIEIHSGRNRIVRRIFEKLGYQVVKLDRVYFAGLTKKNVQRGRWRYLSEKEVNMLRMGAFD